MDSFWDDCTAFFEQLQPHFNTNDVLLADRLATRGHDYVHIISVIRSRVATATSEHDDTQQLIQKMVSDLSTVGQELEDMVEHFESISIGANCMQNAWSFWKLPGLVLQGGPHMSFQGHKLKQW